MFKGSYQTVEKYPLVCGPYRVPFLLNMPGSGHRVMKVELRRTTISLPTNFPIAFYNSIPLIYCFCSIILATAYDVIFERKDEQEALV